MICNLFSEPTYFIFSSDLPDLLYYSHIPAAVIALLVGLFVFINNRKLLLNQLLLIISICFSFWALANLILWTNIHSDFLLFVWIFLAVFSSLISIFSIYFMYVFLYKHDISFSLKLVFLLLLAPVLMLANTDLSLSGFDITNCDAFMFEGIIFKIYHTSLGVLAMLWIFVLLIKNYFKSAPEFKKQILLMGTGIEFFLFSFFTLVFFASYLTGIGILPDSSLEMYGLFGMIVFMVFIAILIVQFKVFKVGLIAPQVLVVALVVLIGSLLFVVKSLSAQIVSAGTLILVIILGFILVKSVKKEIKQREEIEKLAVNLEKANGRLKILDKQKSEFVSIASHQLRSPLTSIRGYISMMQEGSFGTLSAKMIDPLKRINDSTAMMASSIEDFLSVSRIESGNMKYEYSDFNLRDQAEHIVDDLRQEAIKKGLLLMFRTNISCQGIVHADIGKTQQIIHNLINNSLKYTHKGTITVYLHDDKKRKLLFIEIIDTGIGMSQVTIESLFEKFSRASNANSVNIKGTGLGLFVAREMARAMKGEVTAHSEGEGKGSHFIFTIPFQQ